MGRCLGVGDLEGRQLCRARDPILRERRGDRVADLVVAHVLEQRLRHALREASVLLTPNQDRVQDGTAVIDRHVTDGSGVPRLSVDLHDGHVSAEREGRAGLAVDARRPKRPGVEPRREAVGIVGRCSEL